MLMTTNLKQVRVMSNAASRNWWHTFLEILEIIIHKRAIHKGMHNVGKTIQTTTYHHSRTKQLELLLSNT